ncbi:rhomboid family intramembrane serine protease [Clostridium sp.]|uniref:rhomboid family intramembrane serine protease n=1 Tax=Clostridium sp. TaxID=1506 RepID=UPI002FCA257F
MFNVKNLPKVTIILVLIYLSLFIFDKSIFQGKLFEWGCGKSFSNLQGNEWYRVITGSFFHANIFHLLGNAFAIFCVGIILENKMGSSYFLSIYLIGNIVESIISAINSNYIRGCGASPGIYAIIACIVFLYLYNPGLLKLNFNEWSCNYTVWYFFLGNFIGIHGLVAHLIGFGSGIFVSSILLFRGTLK